MRRNRWRGRARTSALALVVFVVAHNLTFVVTYAAGAGDALERTGHGSVWATTVTVVLALAAGLTLATMLQLGSLVVAARNVARSAAEQPGTARSLAIPLARLWLAVVAVALLLFFASENLEHVAAGLRAPGLGVFGSAEYHFALPIFALLGFVAALAESLYRWQRDRLVALIGAASSGRAWSRRATGRPNAPWLDRRHGSIAGNRITGRAPPRMTR